MIQFVFASVFYIFATNVVFSPDPLSFSPHFPAIFNVHIAARLAEASEHIPKKRSQGTFVQPPPHGRGCAWRWDARSG